jgi:hypothetical protein
VIINYKEERFILAHIFGCFSTWLVNLISFWAAVRGHDGSVWHSKADYLMAAGKQREEEGPGPPVSPSRAHLQDQKISH